MNAIYIVESTAEDASAAAEDEKADEDKPEDDEEADKQTPGIKGFSPLRTVFNTRKIHKAASQLILLSKFTEVVVNSHEVNLSSQFIHREIGFSFLFSFL